MNLNLFPILLWSDVLPSNNEEMKHFLNVGIEFNQFMVALLLIVLITIMMVMIFSSTIKQRFSNAKEYKDVREHNKQVKANLKKKK